MDRVRIARAYVLVSCAVAIGLAALQPAVCLAGLTTKAAKEAAELVIRKFGKEAEEQGLQMLTRKIESLSLKYGDEAAIAVKKVGPRTFRVVEEAGENGLQSVRLLSRYGDDAVWVAGNKSRLALFTKYGDGAAEAMIKQGKIAEPLLDSLGKPAANALKTVSRQNGRRLAMMAEDGTLRRIGRTDELLNVVGRFGDRGMNFVWRNKGTLAVAATLAAFLANPEPFIDGAVELTTAAAESVGKPLANEIGKNANWTLVLPLLAAVAAVLIGFKLWLRQPFARFSRRPGAM
ncbi:MAG TPA: hypothetical protein VG125_10015 [Pirellulales bacterium]|jgi:hypothetical protein|nr:hypothetical protein [Pirellulales bacterium]